MARQPLLPRILMGMNAFFTLSMCAMLLADTDNFSKTFPKVAPGAATDYKLWQLEIGGLVVGLGCLVSLVLGFTGGAKVGPSSTVPPLLGAVAYHAVLSYAQFFYAPAAGVPGELSGMQAPTHAALAGLSFVCVLIAHWQRWGGATPKPRGGANRQSVLARVALGFTAVSEGFAVVVVIAGPAQAVQDGGHADVDTDPGLANFFILILASGMATAALSCFGALASGATGGDAVDAVPALTSAAVYHGMITFVGAAFGPGAGLATSGLSAGATGIQVVHAGLAVLSLVAIANKDAPKAGRD